VRACSGIIGNGQANYNATGANLDLPGFTNENLDDHWGGRSDHSNEYPGFTKAQYAQTALDLVRSATNNNILGYKTSNGAIVRYDKATNDFVKGFDTGIATMFKLKGGERRFKSLMRREGGLQDD